MNSTEVDEGSGMILRRVYNLINLPLGSLYANALNEPVEISRMACVTLNLVAIEKFVSLLRQNVLVCGILMLILGLQALSL